MKTYLFTLFVRFFVALSGVVFFFISSKIFGPEGRGIIGLGTSIVSFFGLLFSFNLGRSFLFITKSNLYKKKLELPKFLFANLILILLGIFISILFWFLYAKEIFNLKIMAAFLMLLPYYLWAVNGSAIYATMNKTSIQDLIILFHRISLMIVLCIFYFLIISQDFITFIYIYCFFMFIGFVFEIFFLSNPFKIKLRFINIMNYLSLSKSFHLDYLAFHLYQLVLIIIAASVIELKELGRLNFLIQIMNFLFIFSVVASIRVKKYVAFEGFVSNFKKIKFLYFFSMFVSIILAFLIFQILKSSFFFDHFSNFGILSNFFLIACFAIPGYFTYQFIYPLLIEYNFIKLSMKINLFIFTIMTLLTFPIIKAYGICGGIMLFSSFYLLILTGQIYIWKKISIIFK